MKARQLSNVKHLHHPHSTFRSLCGLPFPGWRKDGRRHTLPELADVSTCIKCNWYFSMQKEALKVAE